ncbi:MAG: hypothetical protein LBL35_08930 [Clostridiales bacterium]|jgi:hypothetical protein|nr:hypothetical protein [Clostridiales bacterium]
MNAIATVATVCANSFKKSFFYYEISECAAHFNDEVRARLAALKKDSPEYENAVGVAALCEKALEFEEEKRGVTRALRQAREGLAAFQNIDSLTEEDAETLVKIANTLVSFKKELDGVKTSYKCRYDENDENALEHMRQAEKFQRALVSDIAGIESEKDEIERERTLMSFAYKAVKRFSLAGAFLSIIVVFFAARSLAGALTPEALTAPALTALAYAVLFRAVKERLRLGLRKNMKKLNRAVALLNKKNALYAHYTNYLEYEYKKYNVRGSKFLERGINEYKICLKESERADAMRKAKREAERRLRAFMERKKIYCHSDNLYQFAKDVSERLKKARELSSEKAALESRLVALEKRSGDIWRLINDARDRDVSRERVVERIIRGRFA